MIKTYVLLLNDKVYGTGSIEHINELIREYLIVRKMYNKEVCNFKVMELNKYYEQLQGKYPRN